MSSEEGFNEIIVENFDKGRCKTKVPAKAPTWPNKGSGKRIDQSSEKGFNKSPESEKVKLDEGSNEIPMRFKYGIRKRVPMRTPKKVSEKGCDDGSDRMMEKGFTRVLC